MKVTVTKEMEVTAHVNPMKNVTGDIYQGRNGTWYWHICLPQGIPEIVKGGIMNPSGQYFWYSGSEETEQKARRGMSAMAGRIYTAMVNSKGLLKKAGRKIEF